MHPVFEERRYLIPFRSTLLPHIFTDTLVIGGGAAGMRAAIEAGKHGEVVMLVKASIDECATDWAQGGIAAVSSPDDTIECHVDDTLTAGAGLCDESIVRGVARDAPGAIEELVEWGMQFDRDGDGELELGREGGHTKRRILHSGGAQTGHELIRCLEARVRADERVRVFDHCFAVDLLSIPNGEPRILGAITHHPRYGLQIIWARATILATGGAGQVYRETTNPRVATGDGLAMAWRAGAAVADTEFMQFHPTTLYVAGAARLLISEAVRGEGAHLVDRDGGRFMEGVHDLAELAPRDVVSRAIVEHLERSQATAAYLDVRHLGERFTQRFPGLTSMLNGLEIDPLHDLIPVRPCAHYTIGGLWTDADGRTSLPGLFACGESACNGLHGANRLASNSLLEGLVFGRRAGVAAGEGKRNGQGPVKIISTIHLDEHGELDLVDVRSSLRSAMWQNVGIRRSGPRLADAVDMFDFWARYTLDNIFDAPDDWETQNLLTIAALASRAAAWRCESRGVHARSDFPEPDERFLVHSVWTGGSSEPELARVLPDRASDTRPEAANA